VGYKSSPTGISKKQPPQGSAIIGVEYVHVHIPRYDTRAEVVGLCKRSAGRKTSDQLHSTLYKVRVRCCRDKTTATVAGVRSIDQK
jgi:hypothetical protein